MEEMKPQKPEFKTMSELLKDAEKYDTANQKEISLTLLESLVDYIKTYTFNNK